MQWLNTYCLLGTEDAHLQKLGEPWGREGDRQGVTTPVHAPGKGAASRSSGERVGTGRGLEGPLTQSGPEIDEDHGDYGSPCPVACIPHAQPWWVWQWEQRYKTCH